ncbi:MAG: ATP-binding protein [Acidobacteriota bacterium]
MRLLSVGNDSDTVRLLESYCLQEGHHLGVAGSIELAEKAIRERPPDLLLLAINRESRRWRNLIDTAKQMNTLPALICVGNHSEQDVSCASEMKPVGYLVTPVHGAVLRMVCRQVQDKLDMERRILEARAESNEIQEDLVESLRRQKEIISEKELTYRELLIAYSRLQELNQQRNNFMAMATHELRTPVTIMKGYHRILLDERLGALKPQQKEVLLESEESCNRLIKIINSMLDLSRIEAGKLDLVYQEADFASNLKLVAQQLKESCKRKGLSLEVKVERKLPRIRFDRDRVNQVLTNLVENSIKYTPAGGRIYVRAGTCFWDRSQPLPVLQELKFSGDGPPVSQSWNALLVEVGDTGIGISSEHQQEIFEQFTQVSTNQMNRSGLGLGLAISKRIIDAHGGKIWVDSQPNMGSRFRFLLPLKPDVGSNTTSQSEND